MEVADVIRAYPLTLDSSNNASLYLIHLHNFMLFFIFIIINSSSSTQEGRNKKKKKKMRDVHDDQTRVLYQLCSMIINILASPPLPIPFPTTTAFIRTTLPSSSTSASPQPSSYLSATAFAALFIGISFVLMLFGSAIFVIGFMLMPCVIALVMLFYFAGIVSNLCYLAGLVLSPSTRIVSAWRSS